MTKFIVLIDSKQESYALPSLQQGTSELEIMSFLENASPNCQNKVGIGKKNKHSKFKYKLEQSQKTKNTEMPKSITRLLSELDSDNGRNK